MLPVAFMPATGSGSSIGDRRCALKQARSGSSALEGADEPPAGECVAGKRCQDRGKIEALGEEERAIGRNDLEDVAMGAVARTGRGPA